MTTPPLQLIRPLVAVDLETTGLEPQTERIVEFGGVKIHTDGTRTLLTQRFNPTIPINPAATRIHGIHNSDVIEMPTFAAFAEQLWNFLADCDLTGFNIDKFDLLFLIHEFKRVGKDFPQANTSIVDSLSIFRRAQPANLARVYHFYCGKTLTHAHSAHGDAEAAADILLEQVSKHQLPKTAAELQAYARNHTPHPNSLDPDGKIIWQDDEAVINFGKYRKKSLRTLAEEDPGYLRWVSQADFSTEVKTAASQALDGKFP